MGRSEGARLSRGKKLRFAVLAALLGLLALEGAARLVDWKTGFHGKVLRALDRIEPQSGPIPMRDSLDWPEGWLQVRSAFGEEPLDQPYVLGGELVPGGMVVPATVPYGTEEAREDPRRKVFVVGGSAAFGFPAAYSESFAAVLAERVDRDRYLVLNASRVGWSSGHLVPVVDRIARGFSPAVVILYLGNNEWSRFSLNDEVGVSPLLLRIYRRLSPSRLLSLGIYWRVKTWEQRQGTARAQGGDGGYVNHRELVGYEYALRHPAPDFNGARWEEAREAFLDNFEINLRVMVRKSSSAGAKVLLCTVPFRFRLSPAWKQRQPLSYDPANRGRVAAALESATTSLRRGDPASAIATLDGALAVEPKAPLLRYVKASALERSGRLEEAERWYARARDAMVGNLGASTSINDRIREVAREERATLVDLEAAFDRYQSARGAHFNEGLIGDDCHPSPEGQRVIAEALSRHFE